MSEFRKKILRSSATTDEYDQEYDYNRISDVYTQVNDLMYTYYGHDTSYLPYTHDRTGDNHNRTYVFNPEAADIFIEEMMTTLDELYWYRNALPEDFFIAFNDDARQFYKSFLYLAIRIGAVKNRARKPEGHHEPVGSGTFKDLAILANSIVIPYRDETFHRRFEIGILDPELPGIFFDIQEICRAIDKEGAFFHIATSSQEQAKAYNADNEAMMQEARRIADSRGQDFDQYMASEQYLKESNEYYKQQENEKFRKLLGDFNDEDNFIKNARIFRDLIFQYNNHEVENYLDKAIKLFLLRNNHSVLSDRETFLDAHEQVAHTINRIKNM